MPQARLSPATLLQPSCTCHRHPLCQHHLGSSVFTPRNVTAEKNPTITFGGAPVLALFFLLLRIQEAARLLKEVPILGPNRKEWVMLWAEIPEHGQGVTHARRCSEFPLPCGRLGQTRLGSRAFFEAQSNAGKTP